MSVAPMIDRAPALRLPSGIYIPGQPIVRQPRLWRPGLWREAPLQAAFTYLENKQKSTQSGTSIAVTMTVHVTALDLIMGIFRADTATSFSVSDSVNGAWTQAWTVTGGDGKVRRCFYVQSAVADSPVVTLSSGGAASVMVMNVDHFGTGGAAVTLDQTATAENGDPSPASLGTTASIVAGGLCRMHELGLLVGLQRRRDDERSRHDALGGNAIHLYLDRC